MLYLMLNASLAGAYSKSKLLIINYSLLIIHSISLPPLHQSAQIGRQLSGHQLVLPDAGVVVGTIA